MLKMRIFAVVFGVLVPTVFAQSEILLRFLHLNRQNLSISQSCEQDLQVIDESLGRKEIWAMKSELKRFIEIVLGINKFGGFRRILKKCSRNHKEIIKNNKKLFHGL